MANLTLFLALLETRSLANTSSCSNAMEKLENISLRILMPNDSKKVLINKILNFKLFSPTFGKTAYSNDPLKKVQFFPELFPNNKFCEVFPVICDHWASCFPPIPPPSAPSGWSVCRYSRRNAKQLPGSSSGSQPAPGTLHTTTAPAQPVSDSSPTWQRLELQIPRR